MNHYIIEIEIDGRPEMVIVRGQSHDEAQEKLIDHLEAQGKRHGNITLSMRRNPI